MPAPAPRHSPTLIFAGGGTGGHLFPGIAVAEHWQKIFPDSRILFAGSGRPIEKQILSQTPFSALSFPFQSPRKAWRQPLKFLRHWRTSLQSARKLIVDERPQLVIGLGGFASYPVLQAAARQNIPLVLLEQNAIPGKATTYFARQAACVCTSFAESAHFLPRRTRVEFTGNPLRSSVVELRDNLWNSPRRTLLISGGSQGSASINQLMLQFLNQFPQALQGWKIRHQTGPITPTHPLKTSLHQAYERHHLPVELQEFYADPALLYQEVGLTVCRAGGTTLAELACLKIPALIVPIARSIRNHQTLNARQHLQSKAGVQLSERSPTLQSDFNTALQQLLQQPALSVQENLSPGSPHCHATQSVVRLLQELLPLSHGK